MKVKVKLNLKEIRNKRGLTQIQVCDKCGIKRAAISHYRYIEHGQKTPSVVKAIQIARALNCSVEDIWEVK